MLTNRQREIALILINNEQKLYYQNLAEMFTVSIRTIKSDMKEVKRWFKRHEVIVETKPNKGICLTHLEEGKKIKIYYELLMVSVDEEIWGKEGRIRRIVLVLILDSTKYITAEFLANQLLVSKETIYNDMKKVKENLSIKNLTLNVIPRKGYVVTGEEVCIRHYAEYLLTHNNIIAEHPGNPNLNLKFKEEFVLLSPKIGRIVQLVEQEIQCYLIGKDTNYQPTTLEICTLFTRVVISICRVSKGNNIELNTYKTQLDGLFTEFSAFFYTVAESVFEHSHIKLTNDEFIYIYRNALFNERSNLLEMTHKIIHYVSSKLSIPFYNDNALQTNLFSHFLEKFTDENAILLENNPFIDDIRTEYSYLYYPVKEACEKYIAYHNLPTEFVSSFVTLHFLVSVDTTFSKKKFLKALYICASGRGVARVVKNRVEKEVPQIKIIQYCGLEEFEAVMKKCRFDLIISVFPLETNTPTVWIEPVPSEKNIEELKSVVRELIGNDYMITKPVLLEEKINKVDPKEISQEIILQAMELYMNLKQAFKDRIRLDMEDTFLMHIFLMVHRVTFNMEYDHLVNPSSIKTEDFQKVDKIFEKQGINTSTDEKNAILFYFE